MNEHDFFVCPDLKDTAFRGDVTLGISEGRMAGVQTARVSLDIEGARACRTLQEKLANRRRLPVRVLDQPFSMVLTSLSVDDTCWGRNTAHLDGVLTVDPNSGPFKAKPRDAELDDINELVAAFRQVMGKLDFTTGRVRFDAVIGAAIDVRDLEWANKILDKVDPNYKRSHHNIFP